MTTIARLRVNLEAQTDKFRRGMRAASETIARFAAKAKIAALAAGAAMSAAFVSAVKDADNLNNLAIRLGTTTEALSELRHVASQSGIDFNVFSTAMQRMVRRVDEAAKTGKGEAAPALKELGIEAEELTKLKLDRQFEKIADSMSKMKDQAARVRLAMKLFDTEGVALVQTMTQGARGIRAARNEARSLGITLDSKTAKVAAKVAAQFVKLRDTIMGAVRNLALEAAPAVLEVLKSIQAFVVGVLSGTNTTVNNLVGESLAAFQLLGIGIRALANGDFMRAGEVMVGLFTVLLKRAKSLGRELADAFRGMLGGDTLAAFDAIASAIGKIIFFVKRQIEATGILLAGIASTAGALADGNFAGAIRIITQSQGDALRQAISGVTGSGEAFAGASADIGRLSQTNDSQLTVLRSIDGKIGAAAVVAQ